MRRIVIAFQILVLAISVSMIGCDAATDDGSSSGLFRPTTLFYMAPRTTASTSILQRIMSNIDASALAAQASETQTGGNGIIRGTVIDAVPTLLAGVTVSAINEGGLTAGIVYYRDVSGLFNPALTSTTAFGEFIVFNVAPGRVNLRCTGGASGNLYVAVVADETTLANIIAVGGPPPSVTWTATSELHSSVATGTPVDSVTLAGMSLPAGLVPTPTAVTTGAFSFGTLGGQLYFIKASKALHTDTYNLVSVGSLSPFVDDIFIVDTAALSTTAWVPTGLTLTAGKGIIRCELSGSVSGCSVLCSRLNGTTFVDVYAADAGTAAPLTLGGVTPANGVVYIYNVDPGTVMLRATKTGFAGSVYVDVFADSITMVRGQLFVASAPTATISIGGPVLQYSGGAVALATVTLEGTTLSDACDGFGQYVIGSAPASTLLRVRTTR